LNSYWSYSNSYWSY